MVVRGAPSDDVNVYRTSALLSAVTGIIYPLTVCPSAIHVQQKQTNGIVQTRVFGDVKMLPESRRVSPAKKNFYRYTLILEFGKLL